MSEEVPFAPRFAWTVHPNGHFLSGFASEYRIDLPLDDGVLRIERAADPVPGDHVWAVSVHELGIQRVVQYRIVVGEG